MKRRFGVSNEKASPLLYDFDVVCGANEETVLPEEFMLPNDRIPTCRDQRDTCQCVSFACAGVLEILNRLETGKQTLFSTTYMYGRHRSEKMRTMEGTSVQSMMRRLCFLGSVPNEYMPELYENPMAYDFVRTKDIEVLDAIASETHIGSYVGFTSADQTKKEHQIKRALMTYQIPLVLVYRVTQSENHAVALVGWKGRRWYFMNSWGKDFGTQGIGFVPFESERVTYLLLDEQNTPKFPFADVPKTHWAYHAVQRCFSAGIINGIDKRNFAPDKPLTNAQVAQALYQLAKKLAVFYETPFKDAAKDNCAVFLDVNRGHWFYPAVNYATEKRLFGKTDDAFHPDAAMSRERFCHVIWNFIQSHCVSKKMLSPNKQALPFSDVADNEAISACYNLGLINGIGDNKFAPDMHLTRAHLAQVVYKLIKVIEEYEA